MKEIKKILISIDDGPSSEKVAAAGFQLAKQVKAEIALVSVVDTTVLRTEGGVSPKEMAEIVRADLKKTHQILIDKVFRDHKVWNFVEEGKPFEMILKVAAEWEADLIVLGTHGKTGLSHLLVGSVAEKVIRHSTIPTFIIPAKP